MLFLRSSGEDADQIQLEVLRSGATRLAAIRHPRLRHHPGAGLSPALRPP